MGNRDTTSLKRAKKHRLAESNPQDKSEISEELIDALFYQGVSVQAISLALTALTKTHLENEHELDPIIPFLDSPITKCTFSQCLQLRALVTRAFRQTSQVAEAKRLIIGWIRGPGVT